MNCWHPGCGHKARVLETRRRGDFAYRRYACPDGHRFSTGEGVIDKGGSQRARRTDIRRAVERAESSA